jgi:Flp pilus assembly pilin Flp
VRRPLCRLLRAVREDAGLTAVEYAVVAGLVIAAGGIAAYSLGRGVHRSSGRVAWTSGPHTSAAAPHPIMSAPSSPNRSSNLPWAMLSIGITVTGAGGFLGWHYLRDRLRQGRTRRIVRQSLTGSTGQAALQRMVRKPIGEPIVRLKKPDTRLIGRNGPDLHHWVRGQDVSVSGDLAGGGRSIGPETDGEIMARLRPDSAPLPIVHVGC